MNTSGLKLTMVMVLTLLIVMWLSSLNVFADEFGHISGLLQAL